MELTPTTYYDQSKFSNSFYLAQIAFQTLFANNVFRGDASRVIYASEQFAFRQRLQLLSKAGNPSIAELQLPFMCYYRQGNWEIDDRPAVQNATAGLYGFTDPYLGYQRMRWLNVKTMFTCTAFYSTDADAQLGYELLTWIKHPAPQQFTIEGLEYKGYTLSIPIILEVENIEFAPGTTEKDWLEKNRIIPVKFSVSVRSVILSQQKQSPSDTLFPPDETPVLTKRVMLDFLAYRFKGAYYDAAHPDFEVSGVLNPDTSLNLSASIPGVTNNSITLAWDYDDEFYSNYNPEVIVNVNGVLDLTAQLSAKTLVINNLSPESTYNITIWATSLSGKVAKAFATGVTTTNGIIGLKGIKGYTL